MQPIVRNCAGIDVHKMMAMVAIRQQRPDGEIEVTLDSSNKCNRLSSVNFKRR